MIRAGQHPEPQVRQADSTFRAWQGVCRCGWIGPVRTDSILQARQDANRHQDQENLLPGSSSGGGSSTPPLGEDYS